MWDISYVTYAMVKTAKEFSIKWKIYHTGQIFAQEFLGRFILGRFLFEFDPKYFEC